MELFASAWVNASMSCRNTCPPFCFQSVIQLDSPWNPACSFTTRLHWKTEGREMLCSLLPPGHLAAGVCLQRFLFCSWVFSKTDWYNCSCFGVWMIIFWQSCVVRFWEKWQYFGQHKSFRVCMREVTDYCAIGNPQQNKSFWIIYENWLTCCETKKTYIWKKLFVWRPWKQRENESETQS